MAEKTEAPTPRRLRQARERGDVPISAPLAQAAGFLGGLLLLPAASAACVREVSAQLRNVLTGGSLKPEHAALALLALTLPLLAGVAFTSGLATLAQSGGLFSLERLKPSFERLNVLKGLGALFSGPRLFALVRAGVATSVLSLIAYSTLRMRLPSLVASAGALSPATAVAAEAALSLTRYAAALGVALGLVDLLIVRRSFLQRWRMTRDEVQREHRESEGDPAHKAARRRAHQELLNSAAIHAVREASVVIINPTHLLTALRYDGDDERAPEVIAQGEGELAQRMLEAARAWGIPVVQDVPLARALAELEVGQEIPEALYEAVAEILHTLWAQEKPESP